jgi:hypothetical protein
MVVLPPTDNWVPVTVSVVPFPCPLLLNVPAASAERLSKLKPELFSFCDWLSVMWATSNLML